MKSVRINGASESSVGEVVSYVCRRHIAFAVASLLRPSLLPPLTFSSPPPTSPSVPPTKATTCSGGWGMSSNLPESSVKRFSGLAFRLDNVEEVGEVGEGR